MKKLIFLFFIFVFFTNLCFSQENAENPIISEADVGACEGNDVYFEWILNESKQNNERVFAIFRAGKNETEQVNSNRLVYVKSYLKNYKRWDMTNKIFARGEKTKTEEGVIEFYIGNKLFVVMYSPKNKTPCLNCCDGGLIYPQNLVKKKIKRKQLQK